MSGKINLLATILVAILVIGCTDTDDGTNRIESSMEELAFIELDAMESKELIDSNPDLIVVDVRGPGLYKVGHIPGAINVPESDLEDYLDGLSRDDTYLLYCGGNSQSVNVGNIMNENGFNNLYRLVDGYAAWRSAGYEREEEKLNQ